MVIFTAFPAIDLVLCQGQKFYSISGYYTFDKAESVPSAIYSNYIITFGRTLNQLTST